MSSSGLSPDRSNVVELLRETENVPIRKKVSESTTLSLREFRSITRALADPRRFQILKLIANHPSTACADIRQACPVSAATLSHHMKELETCGLIEVTRRGKFIDASFSRERWAAYLRELGSL